MRIPFAIFATLLMSSAIGIEKSVETTVFPREFDDLAATHHCELVHRSLIADDPSETMPFDLRNVLPRIMLAGWCTKAPATPTSAPAYVLLLYIQSPDNPLHDCPSEIHGITRIGSPSLDVFSMVPHDFVFLDGGQRPTARENRLMPGVQIRTPGPKAFYACVARHWTLYAPEHP
jgi:hypothetical protein